MPQGCEMHIDDLLRQTVEAKASDLHLTVGVPPTVRVWGKLQPLNHPPLTPEDTFQLAYSMLNTFQKQKFEKTWELDLSYAVAGLGRFRVNVYRQRGSVGVACRVIPEVIPSIEELNIPLVVKDLCRLPRGLILVTGPTGHGKSTTLAAMIDFINSERAAHIVTIEDPIEYVHHHKKSIVNQRELGFDTQSFPNALRAVLREDPNVIMVGEMRDLETISAALTIAETGHLVFATLHTANASQSIDRIIDVFPPHQQQQIRVQLASVLEAVISQQLLPNAQFVGRREERRVAAVAAAARGAGGGMGDGRKGNWPSLEEIGRVPAVEIMIATPAIRNLIREAKTHQIHTAIQTGAQYGMQTMDQSLFNLYSRRLITLENALARAIYPDELRKMIERGGQ
ncbi:MAG: type IV pilus twitching motility protein PilT [Armatimonadota bacterium]|nr:type IV pilus twitching motility protein PilT [Armatimonadota bacterium]MDR7402476.1 type IV pilus twitching motility protein PilT [Armatimonadota bacterium]MDR7437837.1 type IV pilus twitching motility protein PilT [Armatimonadota bacterium]MDR7472097.1 type IV pilus twitching motility protein PilT [Armatimonadota bacterium]MDR7508789.1 type IV pilus twitching motility protein PilT [Armatimonadota bacterium]